MEEKIFLEKEKGSTLIRILISLVLGFLPSFLIFSVFNQSDFSPSRYISFLADIDSSLVSWISILIIFIIVYSLMNAIRSGTKRLFALVLITSLILAFVFVYLYLNFLLGNDILVKLSADKENLFFYDNPVQTITFKMSAFMNPFCIAQCQYSFFDISAGKTIETGEFSISSVLPRYQEYAFNKEGHLYGQEIKKFELSCKSQKTKLCYTSGTESKRTILVTLNYELSEEQKIANEISKKEIIFVQKTIYNISNTLNESDLKINALDSVIYTEEFLPEYLNLSASFSDLNNSFEELKQAWELQEYSKFNEEFPILKEEVETFKLKEKKFASPVNLRFFAYNRLIRELKYSRESAEQIPLGNLSEELCANLNNAIIKFNETAKEFNKKSNFSYKQELAENISSEIQRIYELSEESSGVPCLLENNITQENLTEVKITLFNYSIPEIILTEPSPICCIYGECAECCDESCSDKNYPVVFLHGHSINKDTSADYSLDTFNKIKEGLEKEGYVNAGSVVISPLSEQKGLWGKMNAPVEVTASYFFDVSKSETGEETTISSKTDNIDTYSLRLNDLITLVKTRTGKDKVIIVAHSMGGLVTRRYVQVFGEEEIDKIILIATPNHGIEESTKNYCSLIGSKAECNDMTTGSIMISKLGNMQNMSIPVYNIIGIGCDMDGETGDGVVKGTDQYLVFAINKYVEGTCKELNFEILHNKILDPEEYPMTYELIKESLKEI